MITAEVFVEQFKNQKQEKLIQFAKVDPNYLSGRPKVIYDSDLVSNTLSKPLPYLSSYVPNANDRVMVIKGVIIGKIL